MSHLDEGTLHALLDGEIPSDELAPMLAHLEGCADCRALLEEARSLSGDALALVETLGDGAPQVETSPSKAAPAVIPMPARTRIPLYHQLAWAATVVIAAGLGYSIRDQVVPNPPSATEIAVNAQSSPVVGAADSVLTPQAVLQDAAPQAAPPGAPAPTAADRRRTQATDGPPAVADRDAGAAGARAAELTALSRAEETARQRDTEAAKTAAESLGRLAASASGRTAPSANLAATPPTPRRMMAEERSGVAVESFTPIGFADAIARLGGTLRLVDGLVPDRLEASTATVRVIYPLQAGELVLEQRRMGDSVAVVLRGPLSEDSLAILRRKVR